MKVFFYNPFSVLFIFSFSWLLIFFNCNPTPYLLKKHVIYNFESEGFLSPDILQTIGRGVPFEDDRLSTKRRSCLENAMSLAVDRCLSVFLHTNLDIRQAQEKRGAIERNFQSDYPKKFTRRDLIRARIDFEPLLKQGFVALQDARSPEYCTVVFRIQISDLPSQIRDIKLTFKPENL